MSSVDKDEGTPNLDENQELCFLKKEEENVTLETSKTWLKEQHALEAQLFSECTVREEPETVRAWREKQRMRIEEKDRLENAEKERLKEQARAELEEFYNQYNAELERVKAASRANRELAVDLGNGDGACGEAGRWDRIAGYCDLTVKPKTAHKKDTSRMRSIILHLKNESKSTKVLN